MSDGPRDREERPLADARWLRIPETRAVIDALSAGGRPLRFVGGCVRDTLLDPTVDPQDLDIATAEPPERTMKLLETAGIRAIPTGLKHGTVTAVSGGRHYEITTLRRDVSCYGRHADVEFTDDFEADAARRDFTINALSVDPEGRLYDYFGGRKDLLRGRIRFVGEARRRIREDYLRILRFFRFFARYGRPPADPEALEACAAEAANIDRLSGERIRQEFLRLLAAPGVLAALELMEATGVLRRILPLPVHRQRLARLVMLEARPDPLLRLAALIRRPDLSESEVLAIARRLRLSRAKTRRLLQLALLPLPDPGVSEAGHRAGIYRLGGRLYADLLRLAAAESGRIDEARLRPLLDLAESDRLPVFPLRGRDLLEHGMRSGPAVGRMLAELERWWLERGLEPDREALLEELGRRLAASSGRS